MGTHPIFESDFDCLTGFLANRWAFSGIDEERRTNQKVFATVSLMSHYESLSVKMHRNKYCSKTPLFEKPVPFCVQSSHLYLNNNAAYTRQTQFIQHINLININ